VTVIPDELIEQVRDAADIVTLVGDHVNLRRTGSDYRGPCPFHGGTHRNFAVIPKKQMYYCFVCHEGGDVFTFYMKKLGMEYPAAVREVAQKCGIAIPERSTGGPDPREPLFTATSVAAEWYARRLQEADDAGAARAYLAQRGFETEKAAVLGLGFAPPGKPFLAAMAKLGIESDILQEAGLAVEREDGSLRPRFWNRLLFPIHDLRGRAVGFGGRILKDGEPKYLNSPDTPIFHKGTLLYNLHHARNAIRKAERAIVVEGYFDVLRLVDVGIDEVVAPLGTAFTREQAHLLKRYAKSVTLLYDSDQPGLRATFRAADELLREGFSVLVATLPPREDPDSVATKGGATAVQELLRDAIDVLERKIQLLEHRGWFATLAGRRRSLDRLLPTLQAAKDPVTRDLYVTRTAEALGVARESVLRELETPSSRGEVEAPRRPGPSRLPSARIRARDHSPEVQLARVMLHQPSWRPRIAEQLPRPMPRDSAATELLMLLATTDPSVGGSELVSQTEGVVRGLLVELLGEESQVPNVDAVVEGALNRLESRGIEERLASIDRRMPVATEDEKIELAREKESLSREIQKLNPSRWKVIHAGRSRAR
jgi:DNA primase